MSDVKPISRDDLSHIKRLHQWAAQAHARGDTESGKRLESAAHLVFERAVAAAEKAA